MKTTYFIAFFLLVVCQVQAQSFVKTRQQQFYLDGKPCFAAAGPLPDAGWFGFRSTASRQTIRDFAIRALP